MPTQLIDTVTKDSISIKRQMRQAFYQQGLAKASENDHKGAIAAFNQAIQHQPDFTEAYYNRGLANFNLGDYQAAIADYTKAVQIDAENSKGFFARGLAYLAVSNLEAAIADAKQVILLDPDSAAAYNLIGAARQRQSIPEKAIASYKKAVELYLDQRDIANCRRCLGHIRELQAEPQPYLDPGHETPLRPLINANAFLRQAVQKAQQKDYRGAMEDLDWALQIDSQDAWAYASRGKVQAHLGDLQGAIVDSQKAAALFANQANQEMAKQMQEAVQTFQTSIKQAAQRARFHQMSSYQTPAYTDSLRHRTTYQDIEVGKPSPAVQRQLLRLVGEDRKIAVGLVKRLKLKHPGKPEDWYWEKAIYDLNRDR